MYTKQRMLALLIGAALACSAGAQALNDQGRDDYAYAPVAAQGQNQVDPPARVARLSNMSGNVSFTPAGENDWVQAQLNRPVVTGDRLWTADGGRAELQVGSSTVRLDNGSNFDFLNLNDQIAQMELTQGTLNLSVRRLQGDEGYEVDTPTIAFVASRVGDYRIDVDPQGGFTTVTARRGGGDAIGEGGKRFTIAEGQSVRFNDSQLVDYQVNQLRAPDDFDRYASTRDERYERAPSRNYVSPDVVGYEDLDEYGSWDDVPEYGHVWYPSSVSVDWAPYHDGHWVWVDPWGWTWVDDAPWGFAPFHYGRWAYVGSRWGWVPGPYDVAPVYSPALVAFVGGGGFGLSVSVGGPIGWFALGPGDVYFPGYHCGRDYFNRVNVGNTYINQTVVNNYYGSWSNGSVNYSQLTYANRNAPRALTAVQTTAFASGQPVASSAIAVNRTTMANARVLPRAMVTPTQTSLVAGRGRAAAPPSTVMNRTVVAAHTPPPPTPSFAQRQSVLQKNGGQPLSVNQMRSLAQSNGRSTNATAANVRVVGNRGGAAPARSMTAQAPGTATTIPGNGNSRGSQQATTGRNLDRSTVNATSSSRVRSADFAHPGGAIQNNVPRTSTAQSARGEANNPRATLNDNRGRQLSETARGYSRGNVSDTAAAQSHVRSSAFAHGPSSVQNPANRSAETQQQRRATASNNNRNDLRGNEPRRGDTTRNANANRPDSGPSLTQQRTESTARSRATAANSAPAYSRAPTAGSARASEQRTPNNYRSEQQASTQSRAPAHVQQSAPASTRPSYTQRTPERSAPVQQHSAPAYTQRAPEQRSAPAYTQHVPEQRSAPVQRSAPAYTQHAPEQRSAPVQRSVPAQAPPQAMAQQHAPPPPQQQRAPQRQTSVARQAPQHAPPDNEKKKKNDNNGGG